MPTLEQPNLLDSLPHPPNTVHEEFRERTREIGLSLSEGRPLNPNRRPRVRKRGRVRAFLRRVTKR